MFVLIDHGSKFGWAFLIADKRAESILQCLKPVLENPNNIPNEIQFDNGKEFVN
jgi:hypothetical protein